MATLIKVWSHSDVASVHPHAGTIRPGLNEYEDNMARVLINQGLVELYKNQDGKSNEMQSSYAIKKKNRFKMNKENE